MAMNTVKALGAGAGHAAAAQLPYKASVWLELILRNVILVVRRSIALLCSAPKLLILCMSIMYIMCVYAVGAVLHVCTP